MDPILLRAAFMGADGDPDGTGDSDTVTLQVRCSNGSKFSVEDALDSTVGTLKAALVEKCDVPAEQQRLIYRGRILKDEQTLQSYGLASNHTIHLIRALTPPAAYAEAATASHEASREPNNTIGVETAVSNEGGQFGGTDSGGIGAAQTTNLRSAPASDGRSAGIAGLGGFGLPELDRMAGGMPDPSFLNQLLQNPAIMQMMQNLLSNPQFLNQVSSPQLRGLLGSNSRLSDVLQNPELIRQLASPETMQQLQSFQQSFLSQVVRQQPRQEQNQTSGGTAGVTNSNGLGLLMNMFSGLGSGTGVANNPDVPPEERYMRHS